MLDGLDVFRPLGRAEPVGDGLKIKRYIPRAKGSASGIIKRNANVRITVKERN